MGPLLGSYDDDPEDDDNSKVAFSEEFSRSQEFCMRGLDRLIGSLSVSSAPPTMDAKQPYVMTT